MTSDKVFNQDEKLKLTQIINEGMTVMQEVEDLTAGLNETVKAIAEEFEIKPGLLVDPLSVYLALSNDILNNPDQKEFTYQVVDQEGVKYLKFIVDGQENVSINDRDIETVRVTCEDLELTLNLSVEDNFQPVRIHKVNGKTEFTMLLIEFMS